MDAEVYGDDTCFMLKTLLLAMLCMAYVRSIHILSSQAVIKNLLQKLTFHEVRRISHLNRRETSSMKCSSLRIQTLQNWLNLEDQNTPARKTSWNNPFHWRVQWTIGESNDQKVLTLGFQTHELAWLDPPIFFPRRWHEWWTIGGGGSLGSFWGETTAALSMNPIKGWFFVLRDIDIDIHKALIRFKLLTRAFFCLCICMCIYYCFVCVDLWLIHLFIHALMYTTDFYNVYLFNGT